MSLRALNPLRHPFLDVMLPWADTRLVTQSTICEYLGIGPDAIATLTRDGFFAGSDCTKQVGRTTWYCPAVIWKANGLLPDATLARILCATDGVCRSDEQRRTDIATRTALGAARREIAELKAELDALRQSIADLRAALAATV